MAKKKDINRMSVEKDFAKIFNQINNQEFKSKDELESFLNNLMDKKNDDIPKSKNNKQIAQDLIYQAYDLPVSKGKELIKQALELDPNNADAYNYLAELEVDVNKALKLYEKAINAGEKALGKKIFIEEKGHFWGIFKTRPYMRAKSGLADCLYALGKNEQAIKHYKEILELNPNDNQGIRYFLATLFLKQNNYHEYEKLLKQYDCEEGAVWNYNFALYKFKKEGKSKDSYKTLLKAHEKNNNVIDYMIGIKEMPEKLPEYIGFGDENEAVACVGDTWNLWFDTKGALDWLYEFKQDRLKFN